MRLDERDPIVMADTGPPIRLAAAGLLDGLRATNRRIVIVDRVEAEATEDRSKPFANEIAAWIERNSDAIERARTVIGAGVQQLPRIRRNNNVCSIDPEESIDFRQLTQPEDPK